MNKSRNMVLCIFIFTSLLFQTTSVFAGARGLRVVVVGINADDFFKSKAYKLRFEEGIAQTPAAIECWRSRATGGFSVELSARIKVPHEINVELAHAMWNGDQQAMKKAQKALKTPHEAIQNNSYDGIYIVQVDGINISLLGMGRKAPQNSPIPIAKATLKWNKENAEETAANYDLALCKAAKPMDYGFSP